MMMKPNTDHTATPDEIRASMLRWFAEAMGEDYTVDQWRSFKAHLYPDPPQNILDNAEWEPDYERIMEDRNYRY